MTTTYMYWEYMVIGMGKTPLLQLMFILRICFVDGIGKPFGMGLPLRKQHPCFAVLEATTSPPSGGGKFIINELLEIENSVWALLFTQESKNARF